MSRVALDFKNALLYGSKWRVVQDKPASLPKMYKRPTNPSEACLHEIKARATRHSRLADHLIDTPVLPTKWHNTEGRATLCFRVAILVSTVSGLGYKGVHYPSSRVRSAGSRSRQTYVGGFRTVLRVSGSYAARVRASQGSERGRTRSHARSRSLRPSTLPPIFDVISYVFPYGTRSRPDHQTCFCLHSRGLGGRNL